MAEHSIDLSVVIPVYKSAACLEPLIKQLSEELRETGRTFEVILVDDASPDDSWSVIASLAKQYPFIGAARLMRNRGQQRATICGLSHARGEVVVTMDDDLQHRPDQLPILLSSLDQHPEIDCVFGVYRKKKHAGFRNLGSRALRWVNMRAFGLPRNVRSSSYRVMRRKLVRGILAHRTHNPAVGAELYGSTNRVLSIEIEHADRYAGRSNYSLGKQFALAFDNICNVSMIPLRAVTVIGSVFCLFSVLYVIYTLARYFTGQIGVAGWTTVIILLSFSSGLILLSLGIIGEYLVRVLQEVRQSPLFIERERVGTLTPVEE
jgi:dolichol-phosphate mannosyltransferase/undecaprenyl-phosphate 4-deoxy-4-formamido-L-arabinose transferase